YNPHRRRPCRIPLWAWEAKPSRKWRTRTGPSKWVGQSDIRHNPRHLPCHRKETKRRPQGPKGRVSFSLGRLFFLKMPPQWERCVQIPLKLSLLGTFFLKNWELVPISYNNILKPTAILSHKGISLIIAAHRSTMIK